MNPPKPIPLADVPPEALHRVALLRDVSPGELLIHEIYPSVQGESTFAGLPCVFVRCAVCDSRCKWCFVPDTPVLMADWSWRPIGLLESGDQVVGLTLPDEPHQHHKLTVATVTARHTREAETVVVNGHLRCTPDHKFWNTGYDAEGRHSTREGWREVSRCVGYRATFLTDPVLRNEQEYERGWLAGMADGDGCFWTLKHRRGYRRFRLALRNPSLLARFQLFAARAGYTLRGGVHAHTGFTGKDVMACLWLTSDPTCCRFERWLGEDVDSDDWRYGYVGGIIDAEGSLSHRVLRIGQYPEANPRVYDRIRHVLDRLGLPYTAECNGFYLHRSHGGLWRVLANARPAKESVSRGARRSHPRWRRMIESVEPTGRREPVATLTTTAGSYVAAGYVVKNCDTPHAFTQGVHMPRAAVFEKALSFGCPLIEITGGEPLLQPDVFPLMTELCDAGKTVLLETSGAHDIGPVDPRVHIILDLKCPDSGESHRNRWANLDVLKPTDQIKFVIDTRRDWEWAAATIREHRLDERFQCLVGVVFGEAKPIDLVNWLLESGLHRVRFQLQMHKYIWHPQQRGV